MTRSRITARTPLLLGLFTLFFVVGFIGYWGSSTRIEGAVMAKGRLAPTLSPHLVSHPQGGIVAKTHVWAGEPVVEGQLLLEFDTGPIDIELTSLETQLAELIARKLRLQAERDGLAEMAAPAPHFAKLVGLDVELARQSQTLISVAERLTREREQVRHNAGQIKQQIAGVGAQIAAYEASLGIISAQVARLEELSTRQLVEAGKLASERREFYRLSGELGELQAKKAELSEKLADVEMSVLSTSDRARSAAQDELDRINPQILSLLGKHSDLTFRRSMLEIRAPISGTVHDFKVQGKGFVARAATPLMTIIPDDARLQAMVRVETRDIDQLIVGQETTLRFSAYNSRALPLLLGEVAAIAADINTDPLTRQTYYLAAVDIPSEQIESLGQQPVVNGMEVTAFIKTEAQTPLEYVSQPVEEYFARAFRDR